MNHLKLKEQLIGAAVTCIPSACALGVPSDMMNLIHQNPFLSRFPIALGDGVPVSAQPWIAKTLDPANNVGDKKVFMTG